MTEAQISEVPKIMGKGWAELYFLLKCQNVADCYEIVEVISHQPKLQKFKGEFDGRKQVPVLTLTTKKCICARIAQKSVTKTKTFFQNILHQFKNIILGSFSALNEKGLPYFIYDKLGNIDLKIELANWEKETDVNFKEGHLTSKRIQEAIYIKEFGINYFSIEKMSIPFYHQFRYKFFVDGELVEEVKYQPKSLATTTKLSIRRRLQDPKDIRVLKNDKKEKIEEFIGKGAGYEIEHTWEDTTDVYGGDTFFYSDK